MQKTLHAFVATVLLAGPVLAQEHGLFCGAVGTEGCTAVACDSSAVVAWATGCTVVRGPQVLGIADSPLASYGNEQMAIGPVSHTITTQAVSLGDGGYATLTFAQPIRNGKGPDFAVFENGIQSYVTGGYFLELAFVEVSTDGVRFVRFPATSLTPTTDQVGTFGEVQPEMIDNLAGKYEVGYGTPFDLEQLRDSTGINIDSIMYVRVIDVVGCIDPQYATYDAYGNAINDPYPTNFNSSGFDLTGVAVLSFPDDTTSQTQSIATVAEPSVYLYPNPVADRACVWLNAAADAVLYNAAGARVAQYTFGAGENTISLSPLAPGVYVLRIGSKNVKVVKQ